jgi:hypothetical protein
MPLDRQPPKVRTKIAAKGNAVLREMGLINKFNPESARLAGIKSAETRRLKKLAREQEAKDRYDAELRRLRGH